ncbi:MAG: dTDP-4-dehydrorhamnose 3,5-epimerase [Pseudomonadales bacterium]
MKFTKTPLAGAFVIELELIEDERGFFARGWCSREFEQLGLASNIVQANVSFNHKAGTLRGMHYQVAPYEETKLVRCTTGAFYDVILDLRASSATFGQWFGVELSAENRKMLYVPAGFGHGYQTLQDGTEACYQVSEFYAPGAEQGIRYNDPRFAIEWPLVVKVISEKDANWPDYSD